MKNLLIILLSLIVMAATAQRTAVRTIDTAKKSEVLAKTDTVLNQIAAVDTAKVFRIIEMAGLDDTTEQQLKSIMTDVPEVAKKADDIVKIMQDKEGYSNSLEFYIQLIGAIVAFLTVLAGLVKKIRALPSWMSPVHWFDKVFGAGKSFTTGPNGEKIKATVKKVKIPDGYDIEFKKKVEPEHN